MKLRIPFSLFLISWFSVSAVAGPFISSFSPPLGCYSDQNPIQISGSGFSNVGLIVKFNNTQARPPTAATQPDLILAYIATNTPLGPGKIIVSVNGSQTQSGSDFLVIWRGPVVTNFFPVSGQSPGSVTIQGVHFVNGSQALSVTNVSFNGANATITSISDNQILVNVPANVTTGPIVVTSSLGSYSTITNTLSAATNFFVPPFIKSFSPASGRPGTSVTLTGSNFLFATSVSFGGVSAQFTPPANNSTLVATVPVGAPTGPITVNAPANNPFTTSSNFVVPPTVSGFSPGFGPVGTSVTVTGANFNVGTPTVKFGSVPASIPTGVSFGSLTVTVPSTAVSAPITVTTTDGSMTSTQIFYLPAVISNFTPTNSAPGSVVVLSGQNLLGASSVAFTGTAPAGISNTTNNTVLSVTVPSGVITGPISVTTPAGTANSGSKLFYGAPIITGFSPAHGLPGTNVTIFGTNFLGATAVKFNGTAASTPVNVINNGQINTAVPVGAATGPVTVIGPAGSFSTSSNFVFDSSDLGVSITDAPDPVFVGSNLVYTITLANSGSFNIPGVLLTNTLPAGVNLVSAVTTQGTLNTNSNPILGTLGTLNTSGSIVVTLTVSPRVSGTITDTVSAGGSLADPNLSNNSGSVSTTVQPLPSLSIANLGGQVQISWPAVLSTFSLQFKGALNATTDWSNVTATPTLFGTTNIIVEPSTNPSRFYRLKQ